MSYQNMLFVAVAVLLPIAPAYLLYRLLPSEGEVEGPWHGLRIKLSGAFAGYFLLVITILGYAWMLPRYEVWTVQGEIVLADGEQIRPQLVSFSVDPPGALPRPTGFFTVEVLAKPNNAGDRELPWLIVDHPGYKAEYRNVEKEGRRNHSARAVLLNEPIVLEPEPALDGHDH